MSSILSEDFSDLEEDYHMSFEGHDRQGRPCKLIVVLPVYYLLYKNCNVFISGEYICVL